jgi:hypothetical protein
MDGILQTDRQTDKYIIPCSKKFGLTKWQIDQTAGRHFYILVAIGASTFVLIDKFGSNPINFLASFSSKFNV